MSQEDVQIALTSQPHLEALLQQLTVPDTQKIKAAEEVVKKVVKDVRSVEALMRTLRTSENPQSRQLSAVLLRKKITGHWSKLSDEQKEGIKSALLEHVVQEPIHLVRHNAGSVVSSIAKYELPAGKWGQLLDFIKNLIHSNDHREVGLNMLASLIDNMGDLLRGSFAQMNEMFGACLDASQPAQIRIAALRAIEKEAEWLTPECEVTSFRNLLGGMFGAIRSGYAEGEEDLVAVGFQILDVLIESEVNIIPTTGQVFNELMRLTLEVMCNVDLDIQTRRHAMVFVTWTATNRPKALYKNAEILQHLIDALMKVSSEPDEFDDQMDGLNAHDIAAEVLYVLCTKVPNKFIYQPIMSLVEKILTAESADHWHKRTALVVLGFVSVGCTEVMVDDIEVALSAVYRFASDPHKLVRKAMCFALSEFSENLQPEIFDYHATLLPHIFQVLEDPDDDVKEQACSALEIFSQNLEEKISPYLSGFVTKMTALVQSPNPRLQGIALTAIGSAASAAGAEFKEHAPPIIPILNQVMSTNAGEYLHLRGRATEAMGMIIAVLGREYFTDAVLGQIVGQALQGLALDVESDHLHTLRDYTYGFFQNAADALGTDFAAFLPQVMPFLLASGVAQETFEYEDESEGDDGISDDDDEGAGDFWVKTDAVDEAATALKTIGEVAKSSGAAFLPFLEQSFDLLGRQAGFPHEEVRSNCLFSLGALTCVVAKHHPESVPKILNETMTIYFEMMVTDDEKEVAAAACDAVCEILKECGIAALAPYREDLTKALLMLLKEKTECQRNLDDEDEDDDDRDHDETLIDAVDLLTCEFAKALKGEFAPLLPSFFKPVIKFTKPARSIRDRCMGVGILAEFVCSIGPAILPHAPEIFSIALQGIKDEDGQMRRNCAFCLGALMQNTGDIAVQHFQQTLMALHPLFQDDEEPATKDNASGAVARIIVSHPSLAPLDQLLPVFLSSLPLKNDFEENGPVYSCLIALVSNGAVNQQNANEFVRVFALAIASGNVEEALCVQMGAALKQVVASHGNVQLPPNTEVAVRRFT